MDNYILVSEYEFETKVPKVNNVAEYILKQVENFAKSGRQECITNTFSGETFTYSEIPSQAYKICNAFLKRGLKKGDTVLYSSHNAAKLHIFLIGVWKANGIVRASYPEDIGDDLIDRIIESDVKWILCDEEFASENLIAASKAPWPVEVIVSGHAEGCTSIDDYFNHTTLDNVSMKENESNSWTDIALILPTSGTTGSSKGAVYSHEKLLKNILIFEQVPFIDKPEEPFLLTSRLTHYTGAVFPLAFFTSGRRIIINPKRTFDTTLEAITKYKARGILCFPKYLTDFNPKDGKNKDYDISTIKYVISSGQSSTENQVKNIMKIPTVENFLVIYGMTELGLLTVNADWNAVHNGVYKSLNANEFPVLSSGKLAPGNKLQVRDLETGQPLPADQIGEFYFNSPFVSMGYLKNNEANHETFIDDWVRSGDIGYYDSKGYIFIMDRTKEVFKYFSNHICPSDLEKVLLTHPFVSEACVIGVPDPCGVDTIPRAFVVLKRKRESEQNDVKSEDLRKFVDGKVSSYKQLRGGVYILKEMPIGKSGKVLRRLLQSLKVPLN